MYEGRVLLLQSILQQGAASGPGVMDRPRAVVARSVRTKWHRQTRHIHGLCSAISPAVQRSTGREGLPARLRPRTQIYSPKVALQRRGREPEGVFGLRGSQTGRERRPSRRRFVLRMCAAVKETQPMANAPRSPVLDRPGGAALLPPWPPRTHPLARLPETSGPSGPRALPRAVLVGRGGRSAPGIACRMRDSCMHCDRDQELSVP